MVIARRELVHGEGTSGKEGNRPILNKVFAYLEAHPTVKTLIIPRIDRFTRGGSDSYLGLKKQLASLDVELRDVQGIIQPEKNLLEHTGFQYEWSVVSPSRKGEAAEAEDARGERVQFLVKSITKQIHLAQLGYTVRPAPIGLMNKRIEDEEGKKRSISVPHPVEGK